MGAGIVQLYLEQGHRVATFSRGSTPQVDEWRKEYPDTFYFDSVSLTDNEACKAFVATVEEKFGWKQSWYGPDERGICDSWRRVWRTS